MFFKDAALISGYANYVRYFVTFDGGDSASNLEWESWHYQANDIVDIPHMFVIPLPIYIVCGVQENRTSMACESDRKRESIESGVGGYQQGK